MCTSVQEAPLYQDNLRPVVYKLKKNIHQFIRELKIIAENIT